MNISLHKISGLPISLVNDKIIFNNRDVTSLPVKSRKFKEIKNFLKDADAVSSLRSAYLMYRNALLKKDAKLFKTKKLRFDLTVILPGLFGEEFAKTIGHYHPPKPKTKTAFPEIYEILSGTAHFIFQNRSAREIYLIKARAGQKIIIPPGFGHVTINATNKPLVVSDISASSFKSDYSYFKKHRGAAYYLTNGGEEIGARNKIKTEKNSKYRRVGRVRFALPKEIERLGIIFKKPLYKIFTESPDSLDFLTSPEKYQKLLTPKNLFKTIG